MPLHESFMLDVSGTAGSHLTEHIFSFCKLQTDIPSGQETCSDIPLPLCSNKGLSRTEVKFKGAVNCQEALAI